MESITSKIFEIVILIAVFILLSSLIFYLFTQGGEKIIKPIIAWISTLYGV